MNYHWTLLWTDGLFYVLWLMLIGFIFITRRYEHLRAAGRELFRRPLGVSAGVILLCYLFIALLDSIHFTPVYGDKSLDQPTETQEIVSLLDRILDPMNTVYETTYSEPFALYSFVSATRVDAQGKREQFLPRLAYAGTHLSREPAQHADMRWRILMALVWSCGTGILIILLGFIFYSKYTHEQIRVTIRRLWRGEFQGSWRTLLLTSLAMLFIVLCCIFLSREYHILGTDKVGRDVFYQAVKSIRTGIIIGTLTTLIMLPFSLMLGMMAGYFGGLIDDIVQYVYTTLNSIPAVLLIAASILAMQIFIANHPSVFPTVASRADARLLALCIIMGMTSWTGLCRLLRAETLKLRELDYISAAKTLGVGQFAILIKHVLPNIMYLVIIAIAMDFSALVLAEAVLSAVGVGVDPTTDSWGNMINAARLQLAREPVVWWPLLAAFMFMFVLVLAANLFSDALRDAFDPRIRLRGN